MGIFSHPSPSASSSSQIPAWMQQYMQNLFGAASNVAQTPYTPYPGPLVAKPSGMTQEAWNMAQKNVGAWQPLASKAAAATDQAAAPITSGDINTWLNPYQKYITAGLDRNLSENVMPGIRDQFVGAGQFGSPQNMEMASRAGRDTQMAVGSSMAGAYQDAVNSLLQRRGQLGAEGAQYGTLAGELQQQNAGDVSSISAAGREQDVINQANLDAAHNEWIQQQQWPYQNIGFLSDVIHGLPANFAGYYSQSWNPYVQAGSMPAFTSPFGALFGSYGMGQAMGGGYGGSSGLGFKRGGAVKRRRGALRYADGGVVRNPTDRLKVKTAIVRGALAAHPADREYQGRGGEKLRQSDRSAFHDTTGGWPENTELDNVVTMPAPQYRRGGRVGALRMAA